MSQLCLQIGCVLGFAVICSSGQAVPGYEQHAMLDCYYGKGGFCNGGGCDNGQGIDIGYRPAATSADACGEVCDGDSACSCFVFMRVQDKCYLRSQCILAECERRNPGDTDQFDTFTKVPGPPPTPVPSPPPPPPNIMPYQVAQGKLCGQDIATFVVTVEYAKAYCSQNANCKGFYYQDPNAQVKSKSNELQAKAEGGCPCYFDGTMHDCNKSPFQGDSRCVCGTSGSDWRTPEQCKGPAPSPTPEGCSCNDDGQWHTCYGVLVKNNPGTCSNQPYPGQKVEVHFQNSWTPCTSSNAFSGGSAPLVDNSYTRYKPQFSGVKGKTAGTAIKTELVSVVGDAMNACVQLLGCESFSFTMNHAVTREDMTYPAGSQTVTYFGNAAFVTKDAYSLTYQSLPLFEESASASVSDCPCYYDGSMHYCNKSPFAGDNRCVCGTSGSDWKSPDQCRAPGTPAPQPPSDVCPCFYDGSMHNCSKSQFPNDDRCVCGTLGSDWKTPDQCKAPVVEVKAEDGCPCFYDGTMHDCEKSPIAGDKRCVCGPSEYDWRTPDRCGAGIVFVV